MSLPVDMITHHGVMLQYQGKGILLSGEAGVGKSSLALELINDGATLIADDVVDFAIEDEHIVAHCPKLLAGLLHTRELGLMDIQKLYGEDRWNKSCHVDFCVEIKTIHHPQASLNTPVQNKFILGKHLITLTLSVHNPASLKTRIDCWLAMQNAHESNQDKRQLWQLNKMAF